MSRVVVTADETIRTVPLDAEYAAAFWQEVQGGNVVWCSMVEHVDGRHWGRRGEHPDDVFLDDLGPCFTREEAIEAARTFYQGMVLTA